MECVTRVVMERVNGLSVTWGTPEVVSIQLCWDSQLHMNHQLGELVVSKLLLQLATNTNAVNYWVLHALSHLCTLAFLLWIDMLLIVVYDTYFLPDNTWHYCGTCVTPQSKLTICLCTEIVKELVIHKPERYTSVA